MVSEQLPTFCLAANPSILKKPSKTMSEPLRYPQWQVLLDEAILEFDAQRLFAKVRTAERVIHDRLHELTSETHDFRERQALTDALATLEALKRHRM